MSGLSHTTGPRAAAPIDKRRRRAVAVRGAASAVHRQAEASAVVHEPTSKENRRRGKEAHEHQGATWNCGSQRPERLRTPDGIVRRPR